MPTLRTEQLRALAIDAETRFVREVAAQLHQQHAEAVGGISDDVLLRRVVYGLQRGRGYGLTRRNNLYVFVALMFEVSPDFDRSPAFHPYLSDSAVPPDERMEVVLESVDQDAWEQSSELAVNEDWPDLSAPSG